VETAREWWASLPRRILPGGRMVAGKSRRVLILAPDSQDDRTVSNPSIPREGHQRGVPATCGHAVWKYVQAGAARIRRKNDLAT